MDKKILLTGIKPTGTPHLGNYLGAIKPALDLAKSKDFRAFFFIAEYHALTAVQDPILFKQLLHEVAATWLACGLDPDVMTFYRQGDVPEIFELSWILSCVTPKGLMNRSHAYKAAIAKNMEREDRDLDAGINMGLYCYPILMSADILLFKSNVVPVGKDQVQHVEIARDIAGRFNQQFGQIFVLPEYRVNETRDVLPGLDGRKMSKNYNNTIPLFLPPKKLQKLVNGIKTDSTPPESPKDPDSSYLFQIYQAFAEPSQTNELRRQFQSGISWGQAKANLFELLNSVLEGPRAQYDTYMSDRGELERLIKKGGERAREYSAPLMSHVRKAIGCPL